MTPPYVETRGSGPDLVLLHGWALHGGMWGPWLDRLASRFRLHVRRPAGPRPQCAGRRSCEARGPRAGRFAVDSSARGGARVVAGRHGRARTRADASGPRRPRARRDDTVLPEARGLGGRAWSRPCCRVSRPGLAGDYRRTIANFLALQTWGDERATEALRSLRASLSSHGEPDPRALAAGLDMLRDSRSSRRLDPHRTPDARDRG